MTREERVRRTFILCQVVARNLAYYRVGRNSGNNRFKGSRDADFWTVLNSNFIDTCVLEWCKLFADKNAKHYWARIVRTSVKFKSELLQHLGLTEGQFDAEIESILRYRNKFVAHLDSDRVMQVPKLDVIKASASFYHDYLIKEALEEGTAPIINIELAELHERFEREAVSAYERVK